MNAVRGEPDAWLAFAEREAALPVVDWVRALDPIGSPARLARVRARYRVRRDEWARYCLPRSVLKRSWNPYHRDVFARPAIHFLEREARRLKIRDADAAPRGIAKSTLAKIELMHRICYGLEGFVVVLSATQRDARLWRNTIETWCGGKQRSTRKRSGVGLWPSKRMVELHGAISCRPGPDESLIVTVGDRAPVTILSLSFGTAIRGINDATQRPTLVIIDDGEDRKKVKNPKIRAEWQAFLNEDILKLGDLSGGLEVWWRGTVLDPNAILALLLRGEAPNAGWRGSKWQALVEWPVNQSLWDECGRIFMDLDRGDLAAREAAAREFYEARREAMDEGARVLDPEALPLFDCYRCIWTEGRASFRKELQNDPIDPQTQVFASEKFTRCKVTQDERGAWCVSWRTLDGKLLAPVPLTSLTRLLRWDPSMGGSDGDFAALALMVRDSAGRVGVVKGWMRRAKTTAQMEAVFAFCEVFGIDEVVLETNGFQALAGDDFERVKGERAKRGEFSRVKLTRVNTTTNKDDDIAAMEVPIAAGWLQFADDLDPAMMAQWDAWTPYGSSDHDDGPDVIARGYLHLATQTRQLRTVTANLRSIS